MTYIIVRTIAILIASYITGVGVPIALAWETGWIALLVAVVLAVINHTIKPAITFISIPINFFTLGLFSIIINGAMVWLAALVVSSFVIPSFLMAIWFALVLSIVNWFLHVFE